MIRYLTLIAAVLAQNTQQCERNCVVGLKCVHGCLIDHTGQTKWNTPKICQLCNGNNPCVYYAPSKCVAEEPVISEPAAQVDEVIPEVEQPAPVSPPVIPDPIVVTPVTPAPVTPAPVVVTPAPVDQPSSDCAITVQSCPEGYTESVTGQCTKCETTCAQGQLKISSTGNHYCQICENPCSDGYQNNGWKCEQCSNVCPQGYTDDGSTCNKCDEICAPGLTRDADNCNGGCESVCPAGSTKIGNLCRECKTGCPNDFVYNALKNVCEQCKNVTFEYSGHTKTQVICVDHKLEEVCTTKPGSEVCQFHKVFQQCYTHSYQEACVFQSKRECEKPAVQTCSFADKITTSSQLEEIEEKSCETGYVLQNNQCVKNGYVCHIGTLINNNLCKVCEDSERCPESFELFGNQCEKCENSCPEGFTIQNGVCTRCFQNCKNGFTQFENQCRGNFRQECPQDFNLANGQCKRCLSVCPTDFVYNAQKSKCEQCKDVTFEYGGHKSTRQLCVDHEFEVQCSEEPAKDVYDYEAFSELCIPIGFVRSCQRQQAKNCIEQAVYEEQSGLINTTKVCPMQTELGQQIVTQIRSNHLL